MKLADFFPGMPSLVSLGMALQTAHDKLIFSRIFLMLNQQAGLKSPLCFLWLILMEKYEKVNSQNWAHQSWPSNPTQRKKENQWLDAS